MRRIKLRLLHVVFTALYLTTAALSATSSISSADLPLEARNIDSSSQEDDLISTSYVLPNQIFNDGKPYYASKDPISGQLDFNSKKPAGIEPEVNEVIDPKEKIVLSNTSPNIHDYLNLPVKYSSSKFVYPLVSSSYANLKYQGNNKNYMTNKKPTSVIAPPVTPTPGSPSYVSNYYTVPTTKLMAVPPTASGVYTTSTSTSTTSKKPVTTSTSSSSTSTTTSTTSTSTTTTAQPSSTIKYTTSTRKPLPITTTTFAPRTTTTRKKFVPTKKYSPTVPVTTATTPMRFPTEQTRPTTVTGTKATRQPVPQTPFPTTTTAVTNPSSSSNKPIVFTESPSVPPTPISTRIPDLDAADVYQTLGQKNTEQKFEQKPSMSLADIFNSLSEEESAIAFQNQGNSGFDADGNIMQPIAPSRPSPFAIQHSGRPQSSLRPTFGTTPLPQAPAQRIPPSDQKVLSGSQENYSNEYVSYQVQQPNVMQYRPVPGAINNVVISPGQNSATFVLGSQQQVGTNSFGSVEKAPLFAKDPSVQYGTVISEDISSLKRPVSNGPQSTGFPAAAPPSTGSYQQTPSNFHQNGIPVGPSGQYGQRPSGIGSGFTETPPEPPSPYQQLPQVGTIKRPQTQQTQHQQQSPQMPYQGVAQSEGQLTQQNQIPTLPHGPAMNMNPIRPQIQHQEDKPQAASEETQELLVSTNIRFPANDDQSDEVPAGPFGAGPPAGPQVNGHAQPLSLQQIQQSNPVVFPKTSENEQNIAENTGNSKNPTLNEVQYQNGNAVGQNIQIQQHEVLTMKQHKQKLNFPQSIPEQQQQQQQQHIPSQHMEPPPRFPTTVEPQEMHRRPPQNRLHGGPVPPSFKYNEYTRKPIPGITRPNSDRHLPNILPQFRPNAKISSGHPPAYNQEPGNIRITSNQPPKRPMNSSPQFSHRRQPVPQQRYPMKRISDYAAGPPPPPSSAYADANRRIYRTSPYGNSHPQFVDRMYARRPPMMQSHIAPVADSYAVERHAFAADGPMKQMFPNTLEKMAAFEEEDLVINDPPQPVTPSNEHKAEEEDKLEPVVTLQMLQSQKKPASVTAASSDDSSSGEIQVPDVDTDAETAPAFEKVDPQNGLYVVYPMAADAAGLKEESKDTQQAVAHIDGAPTPTGSEYQNTPFSVLRDQPQEPILMVKPHKKPQSLQQKTKTHQTQQGPKDKFPYPIEKPDPSYTELNSQKRVPGVLIAPRIMNGPYATGTEAPIAIAYTPTEPNDYRRNALYNHNQQHHDIPQNPQNSANRYSNVNLASAVISEIRPSDTQTEEGLNNDFDVRGQNYEKDFMAPFYPSVSLGGTATANTPSNGWNILPSSTDSSVYEKNNINRADVGEPNDEDEDAAEFTTKSFEIDSFQPELQGGFKPIYPPGYKIYDEQDEHALHLHEDGNQAPVALASHMEPPKGILPHTLPTVVSHVTTTSSITTTTTLKPLIGSTPSTRTTSTTKAPQKNANTSNTTLSDSSIASTTTDPTTIPKLKKKSAFETSLAALLFGDDEDFEDGEARKDKSTIKAVSGPRSNVPRSGPRSLKQS